MDNFHFDKETHTYTLNGEEIPSVTEILNHCGFGPSDWVRENKVEQLQAAANFGINVHLATELYDKGTLDEGELDDKLRGYLNSWKRFKSDWSFNTNAIEVINYRNDLYWTIGVPYAGTVDRYGSFINESNKRETIIIDIKTSSKPYKYTALQLSGYWYLPTLKSDKTSFYRRLGAVYLKEDSYEFILFQPMAPAFNKCLEYYHSDKMLSKIKRDLKVMKYIRPQHK